MAIPRLHHRHALFSLLVVVVFSLAFDPTAAVSRQIAGGILWIVHPLRRHDRAQPVMDARAAQPRPRRSSHGAVLRRRALPRQSPRQHSSSSPQSKPSSPRSSSSSTISTRSAKAWLLLAVLPLGTWALVVNGTFFAALALRTRNRELMLPLVLFPISIPALLAMVRPPPTSSPASSNPTSGSASSSATTSSSPPSASYSSKPPSTQSKVPP